MWGCVDITHPPEGTVQQGGPFQYGHEELFPYRQSTPHAASWVSAVHLQPSEFRVAIKWGLGLDIAGGCMYPMSRVTCKRGNDDVTCHNKLRDTLAEACGRNVKVEEGAVSPTTHPLSSS